ncbi:MAG: hypothetical protein IH867_07310 [Chloroflexi bacterium]|nr:hypothetical protein [Chloroflexota bacterium]
MFYGKRTTSLVIAVISLAILSLPATANAGETDMAADVTVEDAYVQTGTQNTPVSWSGETDSHADEQDNQSSAPDRIVYFDVMGETDQHAGINVESELVQSGTLVVAVDSSGETDSYGLEINIAAPVQEFFVYFDGMGETDRHAGINVENELVQTGTLVVAAAWSGETDLYAIDLAVSSPTQARIVYFDGMGETDRHAGINVESELVQSGTLVIAVDSSGETDSYGLEINIAAPVQEFFVYFDGNGETDQFANVNGGNDFASGVRLTRADIANAEVAVGGGSEERIVSVLAGETDQSAGIVTVEASISSGEAYVLLRQPDTDPDVT